MTLYWRGEEWWYHFWHQGQHIQQRTRTANKKEARNKESVHRAQLLVGNRRAIPEENPTFAGFADHYLKYSEANKSCYGVEFYYVDRTLVPFFGDLTLNKINPLRVELFKQKRLKDGLKKSSINREVGLLKSMLATAVKWQLIEKNGAKEAKLFRLDDPSADRVLSYDEEDKLLSACDRPELLHRAPHLKSIILVALYTGLRRGEILRLRWADIDFEQDVLIVRRSKTESGRGRRVNLNSKLREILLGLCQEKCGEWLFPSPKRFQTPGESQRHIADIKNAFRRAIRLAGIQPITFHQLRHTFCSRLANAGIPLPIIQDLAGHASIMMTRRYTHPSSDLKQKAVETLLKGRTDVNPLRNPLPIPISAEEVQNSPITSESR
jgi:integrase